MGWLSYKGTWQETENNLCTRYQELQFPYILFHILHITKLIQIQYNTTG